MRRRKLILSLLMLGGCTCTSDGRRPGDGDSPGGTVTGAGTATTGVTAATGDTGPPLAWVAIDAGTSFTCGLLNDQRMVCWGKPEWVAVAPPGPFVQISQAGWSGCGLQPDGGVTCWCGSPSSVETCADIPQRHDFVEVQSAEFAACAEDEEGLLDCWGPSRMQGVPTQPVLDWSLETNVGCAVLSSGRISCWGNTDIWADADPPPALEPPPELKYVQVSVGRDHACALDTEGEAHCWGRTQLREPFPQATPGPFESLTSWNAFTCGLRADGSAECWFDLNETLEQWVVPDERWAQLGLGEWDACGVTLDGRGLCFPEPFESDGEQDVPDLSDL